MKWYDIVFIIWLLVPNYIWKRIVDWMRPDDKRRKCKNCVFCFRNKICGANERPVGDFDQYVSRCDFFRLRKD